MLHVKTGMDSFQGQKQHKLITIRPIITALFGMLHGVFVSTKTRTTTQASPPILQTEIPLIS